MKKYIIQWGLSGGSIIAAFMAISMLNMDEQTDFENSEVYGYTAQAIVYIITIFMGIKSYRDQQLGGLISFGKAFKVGFFITLIASTMYVLTWMILSECCLQEFMSNYMAAEIAKVESSGLSESEIDSQIAQMESFIEMYENPIVKFFVTYIEIVPMGLLVSLISALILKKKSTK